MKLSEIFENGLAQWALTLYLMASLGLTANASPELGSCQHSGRCAMQEFLFSPYLDVNIPLQAESPPGKSVSAEQTEPAPEASTATIPHGIKALTLAFATGECGNERWGDMDVQTVIHTSIRAFQRSRIAYVISTGGAQGVFTCTSEQGMTEFIAHYNTGYLLGFDFDIEATQTETMIASLVEQVHIAMQRHPYLRFSFTLATLSSTAQGKASLNQHGDMVMNAIAKAGLKNYFINLMVMNYGDAKPDNCVVESDRCNMAASAIRVVQNFSQKYDVPLQRIEVTPMIGVNDVIANVFTLKDARSLARFVNSDGLGGLHYWSLNRDQPCANNLIAVSPTCSSILGAAKLEFATTFAANLR